MQQVPLSLTHSYRTLARLAIIISPAALLNAQTPALQLGTVYQCPAAQSFKVISCSGSGNADMCDVQSYNSGQPSVRGKSNHQQMMALVPLCHLQTPAEAQAGARGGASGSPGAAQPGSANGIKVGDAVEVVTGFGWTPAKVLAINGNSYRVLTNGVQVTKDYPAEVRRIGEAT